MSTPSEPSLLQTVTQWFSRKLPHLPQGTRRLESPAPPLKQTARVQMKVMVPQEHPRSVTLDHTPVYIGRQKACEICIPSDSVSKVHAFIQPQDGIPRLIWHWFGRHPARYVLTDEGSTNGVYRGQRRLQRIALAHNVSITLGPPRDPDTVRLHISDPPPLLTYVARMVWSSVGVAALIAVGWATQEWSEIQVNPLPDTTRGPLIVVAGDRQTELRRTAQDNYRPLDGLEDYGSLLPKVVVAAEDHRFRRHWGVDLIGILRAAIVNVQAGTVQQGGSSITQQLARTILRDYTGTDNTLGRKVREALAALKLEWHYSKDELLTLYLNNVYLGNGLYGFESASRYYFGVPSRQLDLSQAATLASILPAPNAFNPVTNLDAALRGRDRVLERLRQLRLVDQGEVERARRSRLLLNPDLEAASATIAPYFFAAVLEELNELLGADLAAEGDFLVETSLQLSLQQTAEESLAQAIETVGSQYQFSQGALVTLDSSTGEVLALVGGVDYQSNQFNRVTQALRQPGSTFKVFAFTRALEEGIPPSSVYDCSALRWGGQTFTGCRSGAGAMTLHQGLVLSENVVALRVAQRVGLERVIDTAAAMGIETVLPPYPSLILGAVEVNLLELTGAYGTLANRGTHMKPHTIRRVYDTQDCSNPNDWQTCRLIYPAPTENPGHPRVVVSTSVADTMTLMLQDVVQSGTGRAAQVGRGEAGKTGTTTSNKDLLFVGYLPQGPVTGIWLGNDDATPTQGSSAQAAQVWGQYMLNAGQVIGSL